MDEIKVKPAPFVAPAQPEPLYPEGPSEKDYLAAYVKAEAAHDCHEKSAVIANIEARNYARAIDLQSDLEWLAGFGE